MIIGINGWYLSTSNSGIGQYTRNLLSALGEIDKINTYYIFTPKMPEDFQIGDNFKIIHIKPLELLKNTFINRYIWEEYQLGNAIKKYKIEVFHGLYQSLPRGSEKIGNIVTIHDAIPWRFPFERKKLIYRWYNSTRKALIKKRAHKIITVSETAKLDFASIYGIKPETIEVTYESINPLFGKEHSKEEIEKFKAKFNIKKDYILYTGGLKRHKNLRMLIKAFDILVKKHKFGGELYILGAIRNNMAVSPYIYYKVSDLEKYAKLKNIEDSIKFIDYLDQKDLALFMNQASCFISLSIYEGFGLPALEAMASGTPSVLSNIGAHIETADGAAHFVYPYGPHRIADELNNVLTNKELHQEMIRKGKERAKIFDRIKIAKRVLDIYYEAYDDYKISYQP